MEVNEKLPERLYKYREFNAQTLEMIVSDDLYYADPNTFNDPMDSRPSLDADLEEDELIEMLMTLVEQRTTEKMRDAMQAIGAKGPRTKAHIERRSREEAVRRIPHIEYYATEPNSARDRWYVPDLHKPVDLEKLREKSLLKEFEEHKRSRRSSGSPAWKPSAPEFTRAWQERDYAVVVAVADKIPNNVLEKDHKLLMWYDQALTRMGGE